MSEQFDPQRILELLERHGVQYLLVGGMAGRAHGATRPTIDIDCVPNAVSPNLERLATALLEMNARLRVGGMSDEEARALPVVIDSKTLESFGSSTWMTDHGPIDILSSLRDTKGMVVEYGELSERSEMHSIDGVVVHVASLDDIIAAKTYAGRPKDHDALPELKRLRDSSSDDGEPEND